MPRYIVEKRTVFIVEKTKAELGPNEVPLSNLCSAKRVAVSDSEDTANAIADALNRGELKDV